MHSYQSNICVVRCVCAAIYRKICALMNVVFWIGIILGQDEIPEEFGAWMRNTVLMWTNYVELNGWTYVAYMLEGLVMVFYLLSRFWPSNRRSFNQFLCQLKAKHSSFKGSSFVIHLSLSEGHFTLKTFVSRFEKCTWVFVDAGYENLDRICILLYFGSFCKNIDIPTPQLIVLLITLENLSLQPFLPESMHQK